MIPIYSYTKCTYVSTDTYELQVPRGYYVEKQLTLTASAPRAHANAFENKEP